MSSVLIYGPNLSKSYEDWVDFFELECHPRKSFKEILFDFCNLHKMILGTKTMHFGPKEIFIGFEIEHYDTFYYDKKQQMHEIFDKFKLLHTLTLLSCIKIEF